RPAGLVRRLRRYGGAPKIKGKGKGKGKGEGEGKGEGKGAATAAPARAKGSGRRGAPFEHFERRAQALRRAAAGAAGAFAVVPRVHVHVRPRLRGRDEAFEVQRGGDAAGHAGGTAVGDVGDVAGQVT